MKKWVLSLFLFFSLFAEGLCQGTVSIGVRSANDHVPFYIAHKLDLYRKAGIRGLVRIFASNTEIVEALKKKEIDIGAFPISTAIVAIANGVPIKIIAMTGRAGDGILIRKEDHAQSVLELRGKKIATIRASILDLLLLLALEKEGLNPSKDVELVYFMTLGDMITALRTRQVYATSNTEPFMTEAEMSGWGRILTYYTNYWPDHPCCVVVAHQDFLRSKRDMAKKILKIHQHAVGLANRDIDFSASVIGEYITGFDRNVIKQSLSPSKMKVCYEIDPQEVQNMAIWMRRYRMIDEVPSLEKMVDLSILKEVMKEGAKH